MASWSVFEPAATTPETLTAADTSIFVRDGFSLGAFLFAPVWLLWRRMWLVFLFWLAAQVALSVLDFALHLGGRMAAILSLLFAYGFALEANALRAWTLRRQGWRFAGIACGHNLAEAEYRHFEGYRLPEETARRPAPTVAPLSGPGGYASEHRSVLGVFPEPHGTRS